MIERSQKAPAKINLTLDITGILPNGYHSLKSVMQTLTLYDEITVARIDDNNGIRIICNTDGVPCNEKNICHKAAKHFFEYAGIANYGIQIRIVKHIPSMAGLGGGSSDGAAVLKLLNSLYETDFSVETLANIGAKVGADVPFLVYGKTALCEGIGEKITPLSGMKRYSVLLVKPDIGISTPEAYRLFDERGLKTADSSEKLVEALKSGKDISTLLSNDLERAVDLPEIQEIKSRITCLGASSALMTGSGSCVFGLFESVSDCEKAAEKLKSNYRFVCICEMI